MNFQGKVVMLTGASSGLGWAMAKAFAASGATVGGLARRADKLQALGGELQPFGGRYAYAVADMTDRNATQQAIAHLTQELGPCDILIANAGLGEGNTATDLNIPGAERVIRTNLLGAMYAIEAVLPTMLHRGTGHLVGISSMAAFKGLPGAAAYCASKAALTSYLESLRISLRAKNIAVTTIHPGFVRTPMTTKNPKMLWLLEPDEAARKMVRAIAARKKVYSFPKRMRCLMALTRWLPDWLMAKSIPEGTLDP